MDRKYVFPVSTMLSGLGFWIALVVFRLTGFGPVLDLPWLATGMIITSGALILFSGIRCAAAGGPFIGQVVRLAVLLGLAAWSYWSVGKTAAIGPLAAAAGILVTGTVVLASRGKREED